MKKITTRAAPAATDSLVDFGFVATKVFAPTRGRPLGITRNGLMGMIERGVFPRPIRLHDGDKAPVRWRLSDLQNWLASRVPA